MKSKISILLCICMLLSTFSLAACNTAEPSDDAAPQQTTQSASTSTVEQTTIVDDSNELTTVITTIVEDTTLAIETTTNLSTIEPEITVEGSTLNSETIVESTTVEPETTVESTNVESETTVADSTLDSETTVEGTTVEPETTDNESNVHNNHEHEFESVTIAPTKADKGFDSHTCKICGETYTDNYVPAIGSDGLAYKTNLDNDTCTVTGIGNCKDTDIVIPSFSPDGKLVTRIADIAFYDLDSIQSITIPDSVIFIGNSAFEYTWNLKTVIIGDGVTHIGDYAFNDCCDLKTVHLGKNVSHIGEYAFNDCCDLDSINIPDSVTSIGKSAFNNCKNIKEICIPHGVTTIEEKTFYECESLSSIVIPSTVSKIEDEAFCECESLNYIELPTTIVAIGKDAFYNTAFYRDLNNWEDDVLYINSSLIKAKNTIQNESYKIKEGTTCIADGAFKNCNVKVLKLPNTIIGIGAEAFSYSDVESINIPDSVNYIGMDAFVRTTYYNDDHLDNGVLYIDNHLIFAKTYLEGEYSIKPGTKTIADAAFQDCDDLSLVNIPSGLQYIGNYAFNRCDRLEEINLPESIVFIGKNAFQSCISVTKISVNEKNENYKGVGNCLLDSKNKLLLFGCLNSEIPTDGSVTKINDYAFYNCIYLKNINIPNGIEYIGDYAFSHCKNLENIVIPNSVINIEKYAFESCELLQTVTLSENISSIKEGAFMECMSLENIIIPNSITIIEEKAFYDCENLSSVALGESVVIIGEKAFVGTAITEINMPSAVKEVRTAAFKGCDDLKAVHITDLYSWCNIYFFNSQYGYAQSSDHTNPLYYAHDLYLNGEKLTTVTIPNGITSLYGTFEGASITDVVMPDSLTYIGAFTFSKCSSLTNIKFSPNLKTISTGAFSGSGVTNILLPSSITKIGTSAFYNCDNLVECIFTPNTEGLVIGMTVFSSCDKLTRVVFPHGLQIISDGTFMDCKSLEYVIIPRTVKNIEKHAIKIQRKSDKVIYAGTKEEWDAISKESNWLISNYLYNYDFERDSLICSPHSIEMDFDVVKLPASGKSIVLVPLYGYGRFLIKDRSTGEVIPIEGSGIYYDISNNAGEISIDEYGTLVGKKCGITSLSIYYIFDSQKVYILENQLVFVAECSFENSDSYATFSDSDKEYIQMCLDLAYALPKVSSPTLVDLGLLDNFWNSVGNQTKTILEKLKAGKYDPEVAEIKRNLAVIIQNYVDENNLQTYILGNYEVTVETIEALISLKDAGREAEYNLLTEEQKNELDILINAYNNAKDIEGYEKTLSSYNKLLKMLTKAKGTANNLDKICKWETIETAQRAIFGLDLMEEMVDKALFKGKFNKLTKVAGFTFDAFLYIMNDYGANIELLELLRDEFEKVDNVDPALKVAIDELISDYANKSATAWETWLTNIGAAQLSGIGNFLIGKLILPQFGVVKFVVESYAGSTFAAEKFELYTMAMMSSAIYDTLDPIMDMYLTGKQTMPIEKLKTFVSLYLYIVKAENDLVAYNFWSTYPLVEKFDCGNMSNFIENTLSMYLQ